jgi:hypothetical protein
MVQRSSDDYRQAHGMSLSRGLATIAAGMAGLSLALTLIGVYQAERDRLRYLFTPPPAAKLALVFLIIAAAAGTASLVMFLVRRRRA